MQKYYLLALVCFLIVVTSTEVGYQADSGHQEDVTRAPRQRRSAQKVQKGKQLLFNSYFYEVLRLFVLLSRAKVSVSVIVHVFLSTCRKEVCGVCF